MRIDATAWTAMAVARCLASADSGRWTPARLAAETGAGDGAVRTVLARLELARIVQWRADVGGYALARPAAAISVGDVVAAASAEPAPSQPDAPASAALTAAVWPSLMQALGSVSLEEALPPGEAGRTSLAASTLSSAVH